MMASGSSTGDSTVSASGGTQGAFVCPTQNTVAFAKTRLVADVGLMAGTFHRYIYKPFKAGAFDKGVKGRVLALVKASATAAADAKLLSNAVKNVQANPTLCTAIGQPMADLATHLSALTHEVTLGNVAGIESAGTLVSGLLSQASSSGLNITETTDPAAGSQG